MRRREGGQKEKEEECVLKSHLGTLLGGAPIDAFGGAPIDPFC